MKQKIISIFRFSKIALILIFLAFSSILGIFFFSGLFHEWLHSQDFETESLCLDYTNNSLMYVTHGYITIDGDSDIIDDESEVVARHFEIYLLQGFLLGILAIIFIISFGYIGRNAYEFEKIKIDLEKMYEKEKK